MSIAPPNEDIVARARHMADRRGRHDYSVGDYWNLADDAADEIERLRADNARLQENLSISIGQTERLIKEKDAWLEERSLLVAAAQGFESAIAEISSKDYTSDPDCYIAYTIATDKMAEWRSAYPSQGEGER